jgi:hypothetical protein
MLSPAFKVRDFEVQDAYPFSLAFTWKVRDHMLLDLHFRLAP